MIDATDNAGFEVDRGTPKEKALQSIKVNRVDGRLSEQTIQQIYDAIVVFGQSGFESIWESNKKERRANVNDKHYVELSIQLKDEVTRLIQRCREEILNHLKIEQHDFDADIIYQLCRGLGERLKYQSDLLSKLKVTLPSKKLIDKETLKRIIKAEIDYLEQHKEILKDWKNYTADRDQHQLAITLKLHDLISKDFGYEDEDINNTFRNPDSDIHKDIEIGQMMTALNSAKVNCLPESDGRDVSSDTYARLNACEVLEADKK